MVLRASPRPSALVALLVGLTACGARTGVVVDPPDASPCVPVGPEICDGVDQDCDARIDEAIPTRACGAGACAYELRCERGVFPACVIRDPSPEACNGLDDDCDALVDEDLGFGALGDTITLRRDEFSTGDCTSCSWAFGNTVAPTEDGYVALFNLGLYGGRERPNLYRRFLDRRGRPTGPLELVSEDFVLWMTPIRGVPPMPPGGVPNATSYRVGTDDIFGLLLTPRSGVPTIRRPLSPSGPRNVETMVWSGRRFVGAWSTTEELFIATYAPDGSDERPVRVEPFGSRIATVTLGVWEDRVGVLVSGWDDPMDRYQWFYLLDAEGNLLTQRRVHLPYASWQRLVGVDGGWVYIVPGRFREPSLTQLLSPTFEPLTELEPFPDGRAYAESGGAFFLPRPELRQTVVVWGGTIPTEGDMHVEIWGPAGAVLQSWSGPLPVEPIAEQGYFGHPHLSADADRVLVMWNAGAPDSRPNPVYLREFGCIP